MRIESGVTLSQYRIVEKIGEGGMGVVWKAADTTLGREAAIKVLPELFARDAERLARFEREARLLASLNHPNIAGIFGLHQLDGIRFLAMEFVPGENLAERIARGPLPIDEAIAVARQIAEALEAAHDSGVVHRDLKPANVKLRPDGAVKVLDFGLAKALAPDAGRSGGDPSMSPTITSAGTVAGVILGTAAYMSPEQVRGRPVDRRADIWAFGCLLHEMLTGRRLFSGETISDTMAAVLREQIDLSLLPADLPPRVRHLLTRCLDRDPLTRLRDAGEARIVLASPDAGVTAVVAPRPAAPAARTGFWARTAIGVALLAAAAAGGYFLSPRAPAPHSPSFMYEVNLPGKIIEQGSIALSPDGANLAFLVRGDDGMPQIWVRPLAMLEARPLPGTRNARFPFWSPDGREIAFFSNDQLLRIALDGASPRPIAPAPGALGGTWSAHGAILFGTMTGPIYRVSDTGGSPVPITQVETGVETSHVWPIFLPDGDRFLYLSDASSDEGHRVYLASLAGGAPRVLIKVIRSSLGYDTEAGLLLSQKRQLVVYPMDPAKSVLTGGPTLLADGVLPLGTFHNTAFSASSNGVLAYQHGVSASDLVRVDLKTAERTKAAPPDTYGDPALSPDGRRLAFYLEGVEERLIWMLDLQRGVRTPISKKGAAADGAAWSADGQTIYFDSNASGKWEVYRKAADGGGEPVLLGSPAGALSVDVQSCSSDGKWLLAATTGPGMFDLYLLPLDGREPIWKAWTSTPEPEPYGTFSPDSRWIAYLSTTTGSPEVYVAPVEGGPTAHRWQISSGGGLEPHWAPDGSCIYYRSPVDQLMKVTVSVTGDRLIAGAPEPQINLEAIGEAYRNSFVVAPDGHSLLVLHRADAKTSGIVVRVGWRPSAH